MPHGETLQVPLDRPAAKAPFRLVLPWDLAGDQPAATVGLQSALGAGERHVTLRGVTGSGKTVTMAKVIADAGRPTLVLAHNKTLAAQLYGKFRVRGDTLEIQPAYEELAVRIEFFGDDVERITELDPLTGEVLAERDKMDIYPARHFVTPREKLREAIKDIEVELVDRVKELEDAGRLLEAQRLLQRTNFDLEMLRETGTCAGVENYSRHLARRPAGSRPWTLLDYFPPDFLAFVDESHLSIPQARGMFFGDKARKDILVEYGFRLPSALDNRPLTFKEFEDRLDQTIFVSATPGPYELERTPTPVEQIIRPTGLVDPEIDIRPTDGQIDDLLAEINLRVQRGQRSIA